MSKFKKELLLFFDFKVKSFEDLLSILVGVGVFGIIVFRAYSFDITYDEAYTYLNTGRIQDVWQIYLFRIANTHLLNSLLMTISTLFFPYNDFAIRLPMVLISAMYISLSISISKKYQNRLIVLGLLLLFYYVIQYMALARGYGMSATFILAVIFVYKEKEQFQSYYLWIAYLFLLAIYSSYVALVPFVVYMTYLYLVEFKRRIPSISTKNKRWIIGLTVLAIHGFLSVTGEGKPMPTTDKHTFIEAIPHDLVSRFFQSSTIPIQYMWIGVLVIAVLVIAIFLFEKSKNVNGVITFVTFSFVFLVTWLGFKQLPTGRVLIPYWPFIVFCLVEILEALTQKMKVPRLLVRAMNVLVLSGLLFNFQSQTEISKYVYTKSQQWKIPINLLAHYDKEVLSFNPYYLEKDWTYNIIKENLESFIPDRVIEKPNVKIQRYDSLGLITMSFEKPTEGIQIARIVSKQDKIIFSDTIGINSFPNNLEEERALLLPFPRFGGELLKIANVDGSWEQSFLIPEGIETFFPPRQPSF